MAKRKNKTPKPWYVRTKADELALKQGYYYEEGDGELIVAFIEKFCMVTKGRRVGQAFILMDWQREIILLLYNWKRPDGTRRFRSVYVEIPKKNGKSTCLGPIDIAEAIFGDQRGELYLCAGTTEQATIIFNEIVAIIEASEDLQEEFEIKPYYHLINCHRTGSFIKVVSGDPDKAGAKDGFDASVVIFDELHRQKDYRLWDVFKYAGVAREQPIKFSITTAGDGRKGPCWDEHVKSKAILDGEIDDNFEHLPIIYAADPDDDLDDPKTWKKANPSLGITLSEIDFAAEYKDAKRIPREFQKFKRLRLNIWNEEMGSWFPIDRWKEAATKIDLDDLLGRECYLSADFATRIDLTSLVLIFPEEDGTFLCVPFFWAPSECIEIRTERDHVPYDEWVKAGYLQTCPGDSIDYETIKTKIKECCHRFDVRAVLIDPYFARIIIEQLRNEGYPAMEFTQSTSNYNYPCRALESFMLEKQVKHDGNPILTWCLGNMIAKEDDNGMIRPSRKRKKEKIDGGVALLMALGGALNEEAKKGLYTDTRIIQM